MLAAVVEMLLFRIFPNPDSQTETMIRTLRLSQYLIMLTLITYKKIQFLTFSRKLLF